MKKNIGLLALLLLTYIALPAKDKDKTSKQISVVTRIDPPNWWVGMQDEKLQLCVYGKNIAAWNVTCNYAGVRVNAINKVENLNYLFIDLQILKSAQAGKLLLEFRNGAKKETVPYVLLPRDSKRLIHQGFNTSDFIYLLMPDRFCNGDTSNDVWRQSNQPWINRDSMFHRHGGDLQGVLNKLSYLEDLGITTLWMTPFQENNQPLESYHGYAITDHYRCDPRLGTNTLFQKIVDEAHTKKMKVIMDMVFNHTGSEHWFIRDLPMKNWIHQHDTFFKTSYRAPTLVDPYASAYDKNKMSNGWFARHMPDLNQQNTFVANYLIQNAVWWVESTGIDGFRIDTYTYSDLVFMQQLMARMHMEFPQFTAVGELWDHGVPIQSYFQQQSPICSNSNTHLDGLLDFQLYYAINEALNKPMDWTGGLARIYYTLAQDFLYSNPAQNVTFLDNHDLSRFFSVVGEDLRKYKMGLAFLLTTRGIPSLYYGTEVLMKNYADPDGKVRSDMPGGWPKDTRNVFTASGRTGRENEAFDFIKKLANYRKNNPVLHHGKLTQFVPENDVYAYFRHNNSKTIMVIMHYSDKPQNLALSRFHEFLKDKKQFTNVLTGEKVSVGTSLDLQPMEVRVLEIE